MGSKGLSHSQEQVQMAMWAMFAAPLMLSADLREVTPESRAIMTNKAVIAINQDALGKQAKMVKTVSYFILSLLIGWVHGARYFRNFLFIDLEATVGTYELRSYGGKQ